MKIKKSRPIKAASGDFIYVIEDNGEPVAKGTYDAMMKKMYTYTHPVTVRKYPKAKLNSLIKMGKDAHVSNPLKFAVNRYINDNRDEYSSLNSSVRASRNGRKIMASADRKIPYDLVSMAAILRDWADMSRDAYASDEHKLLADIADTLYNVGKESAKTFQKKYAELYKQYGEAYFDQVLDDMSALDSQVSSKNIEELVEDYENRLDSGIGAATKIRASRQSRKTAKRSVTASRPIMAGPGAGYTVEWNLDSVDSVKFIKPISTEVNEYGEVCVDAECDIEIGLTINAASSYYEGADSLDIETTATISRIYLEIPVADYETPEDVIAQIPYMGATDLDSIFYDIGALGAWKSNLGGGYIHSTFNGVLADADDPHSVSDGMEGWTVTLTDKEVIDYIDQVVTGEDTYTGYALYDQDGEYIDKFENLMDAQNKAEELIASGDYESIECVREETKIYFDGTSEEVYNETEFVIDEPADI